ncbi:MAG: zinc-binding alcohol dehydrogenase family protein [Fimbriiglobus sp.]
MKALQFLAPERFIAIDTPEPLAPAAGDAVVRVFRVGICGTDLSGYLGKMPFFSYPRIPGHELGVEVVAVGDGVTNVTPGDRCSVEPYISCWKCSSCRRGFTNCCENNQTLGVHCDGGLRPLFTVPARKLHVSTKLSFEQLALVETLAIGCHAINRGNLQPGEVVLVIGAGPIGLSVIEFAKLSGAQTVVLDVNEARLAFVRDVMKVPDTVTVKGDGNDVQRVLDRTGGELPHVVVDATGSNKSMANAMNYVGFAGRLVFVGITTHDIAVPHPPMHRREMTLLASRNALPGDFTRIIRLIEDGSIDTGPWITHRTPFDGLIEVFPSYLKPETGVIKAIVEVQ